MRKTIIIAGLLLLHFLNGYAQAPEDNLSAEQLKKMESAFIAMDAVQKAGAYIEALSDLFTHGELTLPAGIKKGDYELIIQKISQDPKTGKPLIYATCAFKFKDTGQKIAFEGQASLEGRNGLGTNGKLSLIAPVKRNIGKESAIIVHEGTSVNFGCEGIESFDAILSWLVTSDQIVPVNTKGEPTHAPLSVSFEAKFNNFDNYILSLNINQSFSIKGLKDIVFTLKGATLDQSDTETSSMTRFPEKYFTQNGTETVKLWKGLAVSEASVSLPQVFKKSESGGNDRITVSLQQVLFDENGFTGNVSVKDIIRSESINPDSWDISLTDFSLGILKNNIVAFGFGGDINIPPFGKHSLFPYTATFNPVIDEYEFKASIAGQYDFPVLASTITLNELSTIDLLFKEKDIYPSIHASGVLTVNAPLGKDSAKTFSLPDITFENMLISRESPYLTVGAIGVTGNLQSPKLAGFELSINDIRSFKNQKGSGLAFEAGVTLNEMFGGTSGLQLYGDYEHWKFREVAVDKVHVDYKSSAFSISGGVMFKNSDPVYGDGFRGDIKLSLVDKFTFDAVGVFGKKDMNRYFLADVFYETNPATVIPVPPVLSFYGFGGGLYKRMQQASKMPAQTVETADLEFGKSLSGISYLPDEKTGLGVMASTKFALQASPAAFNAKVGFEMQFNDRGGLNFFQLRGDASFMDIPEKWGKLNDNIAKRMEKLEKTGLTQPEKTKKADLELPPENKSSGFLTASMNVEYDLINKTFSADLNAFLNAGLIKGIGANDRMGWASAYFSPGGWHTYMGTPSDRLGVKILNLAELSAYFMLGDGIPGLPPPPQEVLKNLSPEKQARLARSSSDKLSFGKGIAFGAAFNFNFDAKFTPFYARMKVGLGAEFVLADLNNRICVNYSGTPGINGWYAQGQAWAFVEAGVGLEAKIFGKRRKFSILDLSVGALLEGAGPNPMYFAGAVGGQFRVMGGLIKGKCNFEFEIGEKCILSAGLPFGEDIIAQLSPATGDKDVNVFAAPQVIFNVPVGEEMTIEEDDVKGTYMTTLEAFSIKYKDNGRTVGGRDKYSSDATVYVWTPDEPFESQKDVEISAKVGFKKKVNNSWVYVTGEDGKPVFESKTATFHTGDRPKEILPEHVKYSYPMDRQYNFYADEYKNGYILVSQNYKYLFADEKPEGFDQKIRISDETGQTYEKPFTYSTNSAVEGIRMEIDFPLEQIPFDKNKIYKLAIVNIPKAANADIKSNISTTTTAVEGVADVEITKQQATGTLTQLNEKEIYSLNFKSSNYARFAEKVKAFDKRSEGWRDPIEPYVADIGINLLMGQELFDKYEIQGVNDGQKIVQFAAQVNNTNWYLQSFYKGMYESQNAAGMEQNRVSLGAPSTYTSPPIQAINIRTEAIDKLLTDDEMNIGIASGFNIEGHFRYSLPYWFARDFVYVKEDIAKRALQGQITQPEIDLMNTNHPPAVSKGDYPVDVSYVLPGRKITTSTMAITVYNPI